MGQERSRLSIRAASQSVRKGRVGTHPLGLSVDRDGLIQVPESYQPDKAAPLIVFFHGAGGRAERGVRILQKQASEAGALLLVPESRDMTWDIIRGGFGPDTGFVGRALEWALDRYHVDKKKLAFSGFSDGASYALSLGIANGNVATHIMAFSPGFIRPPKEREGRPAMFISHGAGDTILPIDQCSRYLVPRLRQAGYFVEYKEFDGPHAVPAAIAKTAVGWFLS